MSRQLQPTLMLLETKEEFYEFLHDVVGFSDTLSMAYAGELVRYKHEHGDNGVRYAVARIDAHFKVSYERAKGKKMISNIVGRFL